MNKFNLFLKNIVLILIINTYYLEAQVGIGTTTPAFDFEIVNNGNIGVSSLTASNNSGADGVALSGYNSDATNGFNAVEGATDGINSGVFGVSLPNVGNGTGVFGAANSSDAVGVFGSIPTTGTWLGFGGLFFGGLAYTDGLYDLSDARSKTDIKKINSALSKILNMSGYTYKYDHNKFNKNTINSNRYRYGFLAQNVKEVLPLAVVEKKVRFPNYNQSLTSRTNELYNTQTLNVVDYTAVIPITVEAIKEQQEIIEEQKQQIEVLEDRIFILEKKLNTLITNRD